MKKFALLFVLWSLAATLLTACGGSAGSCVSGSSGGSTPTVHMCGNNFVQTSITMVGPHYPVAKHKTPLRRRTSGRGTAILIGSACFFGRPRVLGGTQGGGAMR